MKTPSKFRLWIATCLSPLVIAASMAPAFGAGIWDGGGANALWDTGDNWDNNAVPLAGANVEFGSVFTSGTTISLNGNREVGTLTFNHGANNIILQNNVLTINTGISRSGTTGSSDIYSSVSLPGDITVSSSSSNRIRFLGVISGIGNIDFTNTVTAGSLQLDGNNTSWSGGLTLQAGVANSVINVFNTNALGTGNVVWKTGATGPSVIMNGNYTISNDFVVEGTADRTINPYNVSSGVGGTTALDGNITGNGASTIRFSPRQTNITGHFTELNGTNTNVNSSSRMVFFGSSNDSGSALGNTYLIGNSGALGWGRVILGQGSASKDDVAFLYKDGITISKLIELNDDDLADVTMGTHGTGASSIQSGTIQLSSFSVSAKTKLLNLFADTGSQFTVSGNITVPGAGDVLNVTKTGAGIVSLTNAAGTSINGATIVSAGTLLVSNSTGSGLGTSNANVNGGTLGGTGAFTGSVAVNSGGTLSPGASIETLSSGALTLNTGSTFAYEADSAAALASGADLQIVNGNLSLNGVVTLTLTNLSVGTIADGTVFSLINYSGTWNSGLFTYNSVVLSNLDTFTFNGQQWEIEYNAAVGGVNFTGEYLSASSFVNLTAIPEPSTWLLLTAGFMATLFLRKRARN